MSHLVNARELSDLIAGGARVLDVRWKLGRSDGREEYLEGHIPGAIYVDLAAELSRPGDPDEGRHPLPSTQQLQEAARSWSIDAGDVVVAYDDTGGSAAARVWWLLRQGGVDVRVLDGGWAAWQAAGGDIEAGSVEYSAGSVTLTDISRNSLTIDEAAAFPESGVLLDVRAPERFRGETEPLDPVAGHIPGAINLPTTEHLTDDGTLRDLDDVRERFAELGIVEDTPVAVYCGSGVTASHTALVLAELGIAAKLFPGSWSQWSNTPGRPVATGE